MKKIILCALLCATSLVTFSQKVILSHHGLIDYCVPPFTYEYTGQDYVEITDTMLFQFLDKMIETAVPDSLYRNGTRVTFDMTQVIYVKNSSKYYTIYLSHQGYPSDYKFGYLEIDGQIMTYNRELQIVIDNIVNYYVHYKPSPKAFVPVLRSILNGERYKLPPFVP